MELSISVGIGHSTSNRFVEWNEFHWKYLSHPMNEKASGNDDFLFSFSPKFMVTPKSISCACHGLTITFQLHWDYSCYL